ncbi:YvrJ family protein [Phascolarctobacterium faecium]|uniref:YvrJ family protein n=1 Tax=Phascolarctobacterium faecium TaxID=33025 RepID=UPI0024783354|nr:YvrJ family protein [Phascolarctobacterium faecium]
MDSRYCYRAGITAMDTKEIFSAVGNFGFPMVLSWYLLLRMEQRLDKLTSCLNELSRAIISKHREL